MSKNGKRKKNLLKKFKDIDNETLLEFLKEEIRKYIILEKSEEIAKEILLKHGIEIFGSINEHQKNRYHRLMELARLRDLNIPESWFEVDLTDMDVISRIDEFKLQEIHWIDEHNYLFDLQDLYDEEKYREDEVTFDYNVFESDKKILEAISTYETIIIKEFGEETAKLFKERKIELLSSYKNLKTMYEDNIPISEIPNMLIRRKKQSK